MDRAEKEVKTKSSCALCVYVIPPLTKLLLYFQVKIISSLSAEHLTVRCSLLFSLPSAALYLHVDFSISAPKRFETSSVRL